MQETTRLGNLIFSHWQKYQPRMVEELIRKNLLQEAWETAMETCLLPEEQN